MFKIASSPHTHSGKLTTSIMAWVMLAMLPALVSQIYFFGYGVLIQSVLAISLALVLEMAVTILRKKSLLTHISDLSVVLTALILAMAIPPYAPYWIILIGTFSAVMLGKHIYGGLGQNLFNPAMVGYVVLLVAFPLQMTTWLPPLQILQEPPSLADALHLIFSGSSTDGFSLHQLSSAVDGISQATPLDSLKTGLKNQQELAQIQQSPIFAQQLWFGAIGWQQVNLAFLAGGLFLLWKRIIHWHIPLAFLGSFALLTSFNWLFSTQGVSPLWHLFSGATMFCAFFIATDPVTASITPKGKLVFGVLVGLFVYLIRNYGNYPDGVAFGILLANICVPLIDHYTRPRVYGRKV